MSEAPETRSASELTTDARKHIKETLQEQHNNF